jgi:hypothetical protein
MKFIYLDKPLTIFKFKLQKRSLVDKSINLKVCTHGLESQFYNSICVTCSKETRWGLVKIKTTLGVSN